MIFECKDVTLGYENKVVAKNLNFKIDQGDYLCVVGENGTGKSTLIKTLLGLIKPLNGEVIANVQGKNHKGVGYLIIDVHFIIRKTRQRLKKIWRSLIFWI